MVFFCWSTVNFGDTTIVTFYLMYWFFFKFIIHFLYLLDSTKCQTFSKLVLPIGKLKKLQLNRINRRCCSMLDAN